MLSPPGLPVATTDDDPPLSLLQKRQVRHAGVVDEFQRRCRAMSVKCDAKIEGHCDKLRMQLTLCHEKTNEQLVSLEERTQGLGGGLVGDQLTEMADGTWEEPNPHTQRKRRIRKRKQELVEILALIHSLAEERSTFIDTCSNSIDKAETHRRDQLEYHFGQLMAHLSEIAFTTMQRTALLAERAASKANVALLDNKSMSLDFLRRLRQAEITKERQYEHHYAELYRKLQLSMATHVMGICKSRFHEGKFRNPDHRQQLLQRLQLEYLSVHEFLHTQMDGIDQLSVSLGIVKRAEGCVVGGTHEGAWLHTTEAAVAVVTEWQQALLLTTDRLSSLHKLLLARAKDGEATLVEEAVQERQLVQEDIVHILEMEIDDEHVRNELETLYYEERKTTILEDRQEKERIAKETAEALLAEQERERADSQRGKGKRIPRRIPILPTPSPPYVPTPDGDWDVLPYPDYIKKFAADFIENEVKPLQRAIEEEGQGFIQALAVAFEETERQLHDMLLGGDNALIPIFVLAAQFLTRAAEAPPSLEQRLLDAMQSATDAFDTAHNTLEDTLATVIQGIQASRDLNECGVLTANALDLLNQIQAGYAKSFTERFSLLDPFVKEALLISEDSTRELHVAWHLEGMDAVVAAEEVALAQLREKHEHEVKELEDKKSGRKEKRGNSRNKHRQQQEEHPPITEDEEYVLLLETHGRAIRDFLAHRASQTPSRHMLTTGGRQLIITKPAQEVDFRDSSEDRGAAPKGEEEGPEGSDDGVSVAEKKKAAKRASTASLHSNAAAQARADASVSPAGRGKRLGKKGKREDSVVDEQHQEEEKKKQNAEDAERQRLEVIRVKFTSDVAPYCAVSVLVTEEEIHTMFNTLREQMVNWLEYLLRIHVERAHAYVEKKKAELQEWVSVQQREHQRRAPDLESSVVLARHIELQEIAEDLTKQSHWLQTRLTNGIDAITNQHKRVESSLNTRMKEMHVRRDKLGTIPAIPPLEVHHRDTLAAFDALRVLTKTEYVRLQKMTTDLLAAFTTEANRLLNVKKAGLGDKVDKSAQQALEAIQHILHHGQEKLHAVQHTLNTQRDAHHQRTVDDQAAFQNTFEYNRQDLTFVHTLQDVIMGCKSKIATLIANSVDAEKKLADLIDTLEQRVAQPQRKVDATEYTVTTTTVGGKPDPLKDLPPLTWPQYPSQVESRLRKFALQREITAKECSSVQLLGVLDELRKALYARSLFLNVLRYHIDFMYIDPLHYIEPPPGRSADEQHIQPVTRGKPPAKKDGRRRDKKQTVQDTTPPVSGGRAGGSAGGVGGPLTGTDAEGRGPAEWDAFTKTVRGEHKVQRVAADGIEECAPIIQEYYTQQTASERSITRPTLIPGTEEQCRNKTDEKITSLLGAFAGHITQAVAEFRRQVIRVHVLVHRLPQEVFVGLYNVSLSNVMEGGMVVRAMWNACYASLTVARQKHGSSLKGSQSNPSSHQTVRSIERKERQRQHVAVSLCKQFQAFALREETFEAERLVRRLVHTCGTLFGLLSTLVTPQLLVEGEDMISGKHKSFKRLLLAKQKEDRQGVKVTAVEHQATSQEASATTGKRGRTPERKAGGKATGGGGAKATGTGAAGGGNTGGEKGDELLRLDLPLISYAGVPVGELKHYQLFLAQEAQVAALPYFNRKENLTGVGELASTDDAGEGDGKRKAAGRAPKGKAADRRKVEQGVTGAAASGTFEEPTLVSASLLGPNDRIFHSVVMCRNTMYESFKAYYHTQCTAVQDYYNDILTSENDWTDSFRQLVMSLMPHDVDEGP